MGRDGRLMIPGFGIWPVPVLCQIPDQTIAEFKLCKTKVTRHGKSSSSFQAFHRSNWLYQSGQYFAFYAISMIAVMT